MYFGMGPNLSMLNENTISAPDRCKVSDSLGQRVFTRCIVAGTGQPTKTWRQPPKARPRPVRHVGGDALPTPVAKANRRCSVLRLSCRRASNSLCARKHYWGQHLWARGYWVASSGNVTDEVWAEYIGNQTPPEPDDDFNVT